jgi:hypothetical protein
MGYNSRHQEAIHRALQSIYQSPELFEPYADLYQVISAWESAPSRPPEEERKVFETLTSLYSFLERKNLVQQADELHCFIVTSFPFYYFPRLPRARQEGKLEFNHFRAARDAIMLKAAPEPLLKVLALFEENFRRSNLNLPLLAAEIASGSFYRDGPGRAGDLFRSFAEIATLLQNTAAQDSPWELMNQLAVKLNNSVSGFNQSYLFLKALETVKTARPSAGLREEIARNQTFFQRNYCWKNLDEALIANDDNQVVYWSEKALPLASELCERTHLLKIREIAASRIKRPGQSWFAVGMVVCLVIAAIMFVLWTESDVKKKLNLERSRNELPQAMKTGARAEPETGQGESAYTPLSSQMPVRTRTGLLEYRPPIRPHARKLLLPEVRHAVFQKIRLENLKKMDLTESEAKQVAELEKDWLSRCEFYEYDTEDREKVYWDVKIHDVNLSLDARDILLAMRRPPDYTAQVLESGVMLDFSNAQHLQIVVNRLKQLGFMPASNSAKIWDENCRRALMEFKATHLSVIDSVWDRKTQDALFPK